MIITASEARRTLLLLIQQVNDDHDAIEIVSEHGNAVLLSSGECEARVEGAYLLRSPANARLLLAAYENALSRSAMSERELTRPDEAEDG
ncbi:type II toxin-antitoxin system Phd/YefM family antitoxin [Nocardiopsis sp. HNM0947]|uniref:Antitoxin n=1 Tax=Nocardiopsis coralli TaxID=2772213 RepID=A0ABR9P8K5_9ACTN|nr:type II toxin-antitoxin system Phd/YefM family antitoxin [Nocardiopsis coralli]MBE3000176.1 type II toxin-antitoxin system Phd/YefM family antitoxin [Nocardiopsis coralli]